MDWIISDEYKLTVGHVLGHLAAASMILGGLCECARASIPFNLIYNSHPTFQVFCPTCRNIVKSYGHRMRTVSVCTYALRCSSPTPWGYSSGELNSKLAAMAFGRNMQQLLSVSCAATVRSWLIIAKSWLCSFSQSAVRCWERLTQFHTQPTTNKWIRFSDAVACVSHLYCVSLFMFMLSSRAAA